MVKDGLVARKENEADRRFVTLHVTPQGKEKVKQLKQIEEKMYGMMSETFDPEKMNALFEALVDVFKDHPSAERLKRRNLI